MLLESRWSGSNWGMSDYSKTTAQDSKRMCNKPTECDCRIPERAEEDEESVESKVEWTSFFLFGCVKSVVLHACDIESAIKLLEIIEIIFIQL